MLPPPATSTTPRRARDALGVLLLAGSLAACGGGDAAPAVQSAPPVVEVVTAKPAGAAGAVRASGAVAYQRETPLAFNVPGVIATLQVDEGDQVASGQRLGALRLTAVNAGAAEADAALETAERALARAQTLFDRGLVAQARLDDARLQVERARAGRDAAGFNRDTAVLTAPAAGVILRRLAEPAQVVGAGSPVLLLGETASGLIVRAAVNSEAAARMRVGMPAQVTVRGSAPRQGRVERIAAKSDAATGAFDVEVRLATAAGLRSGMVADVVIEAPAPTGAVAALAVPVLSLLDARADQGVIYVVDATGTARRRAIRTAGVVDGEVLIVDGLQAGEQVVAAGAAFVRDGEPVRTAGPLQDIRE